MATYKEIFGQKIKALSADPPAAIGEGQIWYNDTSDAFKSGVIVAGTWASGGAYPVGVEAITGFGTQTAAVGIGGESAPGPTINTVNEYNGTSWAGGTVYPSTARSAGTTGILAAGLVVGGNTAPGAEPTLNQTGQYDGTNWTTGGVYPAVGASVGVSGTQTAALGAGAYFTPGGSPGSTQCNEYNGASWTSAPVLNTARYNAGNSGTTTSSLVIGGSPGQGLTVESFNGTSWTSLSNKPLNTSNCMTTASVATADTTANFSSDPSYSNATELYDGTNWSAGASLANVRIGAGAGAPTSGLVFAGSSPSTPRTTATEELGPDTVTVQTITTS